MNARGRYYLLLPRAVADASGRRKTGNYGRGTDKDRCAPDNSAPLRDWTGSQLRRNSGCRLPAGSVRSWVGDPF